MSASLFRLNLIASRAFRCQWAFTSIGKSRSLDFSTCFAGPSDSRTASRAPSRWDIDSGKPYSCPLLAKQGICLRNLRPPFFILPEPDLVPRRRNFIEITSAVPRKVAIHRTQTFDRSTFQFAPTFDWSVADVGTTTSHIKSLDPDCAVPRVVCLSHRPLRRDRWGIGWEIKLSGRKRRIQSSTYDFSDSSI